MAILALPTELLLSIGEQKCLTRKDHWSLVLVSKTFSVIFIRVLYKEVRLKFPQHELIPKSRQSFKFALGEAILQAVLERLDNSPHLKACVRKCSIDNLICRDRYKSLVIDEYYREGLLDPVFTLIRQFINLNSIYISNSFLPTERMLYLARHPGLRSIDLKATTTYNKAKLRAKLNITTLATDRDYLDPFVRSLTFGGSLVHLSLPTLSLDTLWIAHATANQPMVPSLKSLVVNTPRGEGFRFFAYTPNLVRLVFLDESKNMYGHVGDLKNVLPKLGTIKCSYLLLPYLTEGRPVTSISLSCNIRDSHSVMSRYFGSRVPVRRLYAELYNGDIREFFLYIIANNIEVEELAVRYMPMDTKDCESHVPFFQTENRSNIAKDIRNVRAAWFPLLKRLIHIRILQVIYKWRALEDFNLSSDDFDREGKACEELRAEGCPNISKVCFNTKFVWNFRQDLGSWEREDWQEDGPLLLVDI